MYINKETNASYNFVAPDIQKDAGKKVMLTFPTAELVTPAVSDNIAEVTVERSITIIDLGNLAADTDLIITTGNSIKIGDRMIVKVSCGENNLNVNLQFGEETISVEYPAGETVAREFVWTGDAWIAI